MKKVGAVLLLGLVVALGGCSVIGGGSNAQTQEGVLDVWATWGDDPAELQALLDRYSQSSGVPVQVSTRMDSDDLLEALTGNEPPDVVILSGNDLVAAYDEQGLIEPLDQWITSTGIDLHDIYPAPLAQCEALDGTILCLPWGCDVDALFWNKDLFSRAGLDPERPPQTMEELVEYAGKLTIHDDRGDLSQVGFIPNLTGSQTDLYAGMFGGSYVSEGESGVVINSQPVRDALNWQTQFLDIYAAKDLKRFVSSFTPYMTSRHPQYAGRRMSCGQCHRSSPIQNGKTPGTGFSEGKVAMAIDGQWRVSSNTLSAEKSQVNVGIAPFPPPAAHPERASTSVVRGPVVIMPVGALDSEAAAHLLAWMMSPQILAEASYAHSLLPTGRAAMQDSRFQAFPDFKVFEDLLAHANAKPAVTTPISLDLNETMGQVEAEVLQKGVDPVPALDEAQARLAARLKEALAHQDSP